MKEITLLFLVTLFFSCQNGTGSWELNRSEGLPQTISTANQEAPKEEPKKQTPIHLHYVWKKSVEKTNTLINRIPTPKGYKRISVEKGSFAEWLRYLPLHGENHLVKLHNGSLKWNQFAHEAVINMDVGKADLQQCADAVMRLRAEYWYSKKNYQKIHFNYTSGDKVSFEDWRKGKRPNVKGNAVSFVSTGKVSDSYTNFRAYLNQIFSYAGTASLSKELKQKTMSAILPGDVFIQGGFPGHAVLVLDVAVNERGEKLFMVGQSYMPAQEFHLLKNKNNSKISPWYKAASIEEVRTPEWTFKLSDLKGWSK